MTRLAAMETSGRSRFQRKLLLAEVCLASKRDALARSILEELAEQIDKCQLESWESSELIGGVWTRLYKMYKQGGDSSDEDRADKLYERLGEAGSMAGAGLQRGLMPCGQRKNNSGFSFPFWIGSPIWSRTFKRRRRSRHGKCMREV